MNAGRLYRTFIVRLLAVAVLGLLARAGFASADPPGRVARINHAQGSVAFAPAGDNEWTDAARNRPLARGDRVWTDRGARADLQAGSSAVRLDGQTHLHIVALDDLSTQLSVTQGAVSVRVRSLPEGENFEIVTPNLAYRAAHPGEYRIDVDPVHSTTRVTIHSGTGAVYGENGQALPLGGGQQITFRGRSLAQVSAHEAPPQDAFDRWAIDRSRLEDQSISARFVPREVVGYQHLDAHGKWAHDLKHGVVWMPLEVPAGWAPYRDGHWEWISPWGWTWIDDAPWGFAPFHYGRWTLIESRWAWVPGRMTLRPVYAPALVAFVGGAGGGSWSIPASGRPGVAWFPLAPGEAWQPAYRASPVYISSVNRNIAVPASAGYAYQRSTEALTAIAAEDFHRGRPVRAGWLRLATNWLTNAQVVPPPPMPQQGGVLAQQRAAPAAVAPPAAAAAEVRQVAAQAPPAPTGPERENHRRQATPRQSHTDAQAQAQDKAARAQAQRMADAQRIRLAAEQEQVRRDGRRPAPERKQEIAATAPAQAPKPQASSAEQAAPAAAVAVTQVPQERPQRVQQPQPRASGELRDQARARERAVESGQQLVPKRREVPAARAGQAKRDQVAARADQARREQVARAEARQVQASRRAEEARREQHAKQELARREQLARRDEQLRREAHAQRVEQARRTAEREAQVLRAQREEQARWAAERDSQALREQRARREEQARRDAQERQQADREAWQRQQQALSEQWRRDHQQWEQHQQRARVRQRPDLRDDRRTPPPAPDLWQRGIPILNPGRTS
jgi:hypothetical protein